MNREVFEKLQKYERIEAEIQRERAEALGRAGERLEQILCKLAELSNTIESIRNKLHEGNAERHAVFRSIRNLTQEHAVLRQKAKTYHRYLIIQREAVGFRDHRDVYRIYCVPDPINPDDFAP